MSKCGQVDDVLGINDARFRRVSIKQVSWGLWLQSCTVGAKGGSVKPKFRLIGIATLAILFGLVANASAVGVKAAVIAGVTKYKNVNSLHYCARDATDLYNKVLWYGVSRFNARLLTDSRATKKGIQSAIKSAAGRVGAGDVFLFFFSGHGTYGPDVAPLEGAEEGGDDEYILPYESAFLAGGGFNYASMIRDDELYDWLLPITLKGAKVLVILDSCYSGGALKAPITFDGKNKGAFVKTVEGAPPRKSPSQGGFVKDLNTPGFIVMTASSDEETAKECQWFQNGVFTHLILGALSGVADDNRAFGSEGNADRAISARELYQGAVTVQNVPYADSSTITEYFEQTPQIYGEDDTILFYLK
jgi:hypothetical protein